MWPVKKLGIGLSVVTFN